MSDFNTTLAEKLPCRNHGFATFFTAVPDVIRCYHQDGESFPLSLTNTTIRIVSNSEENKAQISNPLTNNRSKKLYPG